MNGIERNKENVKLIYSEMEPQKKETIKSVPFSTLTNIVVDFMNSHPKDMEMLK